MKGVENVALAVASPPPRRHGTWEDIGHGRRLIRGEREEESQSATYNVAECRSLLPSVTHLLGCISPDYPMHPQALPPPPPPPPTENTRFTSSLVIHGICLNECSRARRVAACLCVSPHEWTLWDAQIFVLARLTFELLNNH